jgi:hypothetical protein
MLSAVVHRLLRRLRRFRLPRSEARLATHWSAQTGIGCLVPFFESQQMYRRAQ